jgi:hypothetical protein
VGSGEPRGAPPEEVASKEARLQKKIALKEASDTCVLQAVHNVKNIPDVRAANALRHRTRS